MATMVWEGLRKIAAGILAGARSHSIVAVSITSSPIAAQHTPDSPLLKPTSFRSRLIGRRQRHATCSGVAWFHGRHIATVNLLGNSIHTYQFDEVARSFAPLQTLVNAAGLAEPENLSFSPDGRLLAVTNSRDGAVVLYDVDRSTHRIDPTPVARIHCAGDVNAHGVSFSHCGRFLAFTTVDSPGYLRVFTIVHSAAGRVLATPFQHIANMVAPLKPKGVDFSPDGRRVVVCYAPNAGSGPEGGRGLLAMHSFDAERGLGSQPLWSGGAELGLRNPDDVRFSPYGSHVVVTNQDIDTATILTVDEENGAFRQTTTLRHPRAQLSFPHGIGISKDGKYLAIANYGHDTFTVYAIDSWQ